MAGLCPATASIAGVTRAALVARLAPAERGVACRQFVAHTFQTAAAAGLAHLSWIIRRPTTRRVIPDCLALIDDSRCEQPLMRNREGRSLKNVRRNHLSVR